MPRGRPKKNPVQSLDSVATPKPVDAEGNYAPVEETEHQHKLRQLKMAEDQKKWSQTVDEYYVISGKKVVKKTKKASGLVVSDFICMVSDESAKFIAELKAKHTFKTA